MKYLSRCNPTWLLAVGLFCGCGLIGFDTLPQESESTEAGPSMRTGGGLQSGGAGDAVNTGGDAVPMSTGSTVDPTIMTTGGTIKPPPVSSDGGALLTGAVPAPRVTGGSAASGGIFSTGGATGGAGASGGAFPSGGMPITGAVTTSGGVPATGATMASGGTPTTGGNPGTGGAPATGAMASSGGMPATGGSLADAGMPGLDAGAPSGDAGMPPPWDAGGPLDSGTTPLGGVALQDAPLLHRYDFSGVGSVALDLVGNADGLLQGGSTLNGTGQALLDGVGGYVSLPRGMISRLGSASFVAWVDFRGGSCGQHIFDFGSSSGGPGASGEGISSLHAEMSGCGLLGRPWARYYEDGVNTSSVFSWATVPHGVHMITVIVDRTLPLASWYIDNLPVLVFPVPFALSDIVDENVWLGRSQWSDAPMLNANYDEFRIYGAALSLAAIQELYSGGPNYLP